MNRYKLEFKKNINYRVLKHAIDPTKVRVFRYHQDPAITRFNAIKHSYTNYAQIMRDLLLNTDTDYETCRRVIQEIYRSLVRALGEDTRSVAQQCYRVSLAHARRVCDRPVTVR
jgi:hypothetical protein